MKTFIKVTLNFIEILHINHLYKPSQHWKNDIEKKNDSKSFGYGMTQCHVNDCHGLLINLELSFFCSK